MWEGPRTMIMAMTIKEIVERNRFCTVCPDNWMLKRLSFNKDGSLKSVNKRGKKDILESPK